MAQLGMRDKLDNTKVDTCLFVLQIEICMIRSALYQQMSFAVIFFQRHIWRATCGHNVCKNACQTDISQVSIC
jgi:hypothetical protein